MKLKYRSDWNYEQIDIAENIKSALGDWNSLQTKFVVRPLQIPAWTAWHKSHDAYEHSDGVK